MLKYALLGFLNYEPCTGYDLKRKMDASTAFFWRAEMSQIYMTLKKLETDGLLESDLYQQTERPDRRVYRITGTGRSDLRSWLRQPTTEIHTVKDTLLLKLFFSAQIDRETLLMHLRLQRDLHTQELESYHEMISSASGGTVTRLELEHDQWLWAATQRFGAMYQETYIRWLDETIALIAERF